MNPTKEKILQAAEIEFANNGFNGATIRDITHRADVNIAAVNYHFGNKADLFKELVRYRIEPINKLRLKLLNQALVDNDHSPLPTQQIVDIIVRPLLSSLMRPESEQHHFMKAMGKGLSEDRDFMKSLHQDILKTVIKRFSKALAESLKNPKFPKIPYAMHFLSCTISGVMLQHQRLEYLSGGKINLADVDSLADHLVAYISGGFQGINSMAVSPRKSKSA